MATSVEDVAKGFARVGMIIDDGVLAFTGPSPGIMIGALHLGDLTGARLGRSWDRVKLDQKDLWIRAVDRPTIDSRLALSAAED